MRDLPENQSPTTFAVFFGQQLRKYRTRKELSQDQLGAQVNCTGSLIGMIEKAKRSCPRDVAERADQILETDGALLDAWAAANQEPHPAWFQPYVRAEAEARKILKFEPTVISGLLQTEQYATAVIRAGQPDATDAEIKHEVQARMSRREVFSRENPPRVWLILGEAALRCEIGGRECMRTALTAVLDAARKPRITVQVLPFSAGAHASLGGPLTILEGAHRAAYTEGHAIGRLITDPDEVDEFAHAFNLLQSAALGVDASLDLIRRVVEGYGS